MSAFKPQQRHLSFNGRPFHFVAYEGRPENLARNQPEEPAMWYLMLEGRRCPVTPFVPAQTTEQLDRELAGWLRAQGILPRAGH